MKSQVEGRPKNIMLVVSSSNENRKAVEKALKKAGHKIVIKARTKEEALKKFERHNKWDWFMGRGEVEVLALEGYMPFLSDAEELATEVSKKNNEVLIGGLCPYSPAAIIKDVNYKEDRPHRLSEGFTDENGRYPEKSFDFFINTPQESGGAGGNLNTLAAIISDLEFSLRNENRLAQLESEAEIREEPKIRGEREV